jgi:hypothetical protein
LRECARGENESEKSDERLHVDFPFDLAKADSLDRFL